MRHSVIRVPVSRLRSLVLLAVLAVAAWPATVHGQGIPQQVAALDAQVAALTQQIALLQQQITSLQPLNLTVDCNSGQTVGAALAQAGSRASRVTITILGVCVEAVSVNRNNTTLRSTTGGGLQAPSDQVNVLSINAKDVSISGLTLSGGRGVQIASRSSVSIDNSQVLDSTFHGVSIFSAVVDFRNSTVSGSAGAGIQAVQGSVLRLNSSTLQGTAYGLDIENGSFALLDGGTVVDGNGTGGGVSVSFGSTLQVGNATIRNSNGAGLSLTGGSSAHFGFAGGIGTISGNASHGMLLRDTSVASSLFSGGSANITNNGGVGIFCMGSPAVAQIVGQIGAVTGNTQGQINCPIS